MKTTFDIIPHIYDILNVVAVTDTITGTIYRNKKPLDSKLEDIVISSLVNNNPDEIQLAVINVNIYAKNLSDGEIDITKLKTITDAVITILEAYTGGITEYFQFDITSQSLFPDNKQIDMSFVNIRLNCMIER